MEDEELCTNLRRSGAAAVIWRDRSLCLLPEIGRRGLHASFACSSVAHLGSEICGLSPGVVEPVLRLDRRLERFPRLRDLFERNVVGWTKLEVIVGEGSADSEEDWVRLVQDATRIELLDIVAAEKERRELNATDPSTASGPCAAEAPGDVPGTAPGNVPGGHVVPTPGAGHVRRPSTLPLGGGETPTCLRSSVNGSLAALVRDVRRSTCPSTRLRWSTSSSWRRPGVD